MLKIVVIREKHNGRINMKIYSSNGTLQAIVCNYCGKRILPEKDMFKEESVSIVKEWGYFSKKDGETHEWDLCESCYDKIIEQFCCPVTIKEQVELV